MPQDTEVTETVVETPDPTQTNGAAGEPAQEEGEAFDQVRAMNTIKQQRQAEKDLKKQLSEARTALTKYQEADKAKQDAEKSELQKAQERLAKLEADYSEAQSLLAGYKLQNSFYSASNRLGFNWISQQAKEDAFALLDLETVDLDEVNEHGEPKALETSLRALKKSRPYLFAPDSDDLGTPVKEGKPKIQVNKNAKVESPPIRF